MLEEIVLAIKSLKAGKAPGVDNLQPEFFLHLHESCTEWLQNFFNVCLKRTKVPKIWKLTKVAAVLKPKISQAVIDLSVYSVSLINFTNV